MFFASWRPVHTLLFNWLGVLSSCSQPLAGTRGEGGGGPHPNTKYLIAGGRRGATCLIMQMLRACNMAQAQGRAGALEASLQRCGAAHPHCLQRRGGNSLGLTYVAACWRSALARRGAVAGWHIAKPGAGPLWQRWAQDQAFWPLIKTLEVFEADVAELCGQSWGKRAVLGIEPRTSRTRSENHATRPNSQWRQVIH